MSQAPPNTPEEPAYDPDQDPDSDPEQLHDRPPRPSQAEGEDQDEDGPQ